MRNPKIKIVGLAQNLDVEDLKECLIKQNAELKDITGIFKLVTCKKMIKKYLAIIEVDPNTFSKFMALKTVFIQWSECALYEHVNTLRCFKCGGFNHMAEKCKENHPKCLNCGNDDHSEKECEQEPICINCVKVNKKLNLQLNIEHSRFDCNCEVYKRQVEINKNKINYIA